MTLGVSPMRLSACRSWATIASIVDNDTFYVRMVDMSLTAGAARGTFRVRSRIFGRGSTGETA